MRTHIRTKLCNVQSVELFVSLLHKIHNFFFYSVHFCSVRCSGKIANGSTDRLSNAQFVSNGNTHFNSRSFSRNFVLLLNSTACAALSMSVCVMQYVGFCQPPCMSKENIRHQTVHSIRSHTALKSSNRKLWRNDDDNDEDGECIESHKRICTLISGICCFAAVCVSVCKRIKILILCAFTLLYDSNASYGGPQSCSMS